MRRARHYLPVLLAAIFWVAQLQGTVHGIGHLSSAASSSHATSPHALHCDECASLAQAGAAPLLTHAVLAVAPTADQALATRSITLLLVQPPSFYRSRAPPAALI